MTFGSMGMLVSMIVTITSSSAAAERPREPLSQLKSCQLLHTIVRKITFDYKDCPFMWHKNIAGRFFGLVTKNACDEQNYNS